MKYVCQILVLAVLLSQSLLGGSLKEQAHELSVFGPQGSECPFCRKKPISKKIKIRTSL